eukprot:366291-Chlamydomonas_euryale.AAC.2
MIISDNGFRGGGCRLCRMLRSEHPSIDLQCRNLVGASFSRWASLLGSTVSEPCGGKPFTVGIPVWLQSTRLRWQASCKSARLAFNPCPRLLACRPLQDSARCGWCAEARHQQLAAVEPADVFGAADALVWAPCCASGARARRRVSELTSGLMPPDSSLQRGLRSCAACQPSGRGPAECTAPSSGPLLTPSARLRLAPPAVAFHSRSVSRSASSRVHVRETVGSGRLARNDMPVGASCAAGVKSLPAEQILQPPSLAR